MRDNVVGTVLSGSSNIIVVLKSIFEPKLVQKRKNSTQCILVIFVQKQRLLRVAFSNILVVIEKLVDTVGKVATIQHVLNEEQRGCSRKVVRRKRLDCVKGLEFSNSILDHTVPHALKNVPRSSIFEPVAFCMCRENVVQVSHHSLPVWVMQLHFNLVRKWGTNHGRISIDNTRCHLFEGSQQFHNTLVEDLNQVMLLSAQMLIRTIQCPQQQVHQVHQAFILDSIRLCLSDCSFQNIFLGVRGRLQERGEHFLEFTYLLLLVPNVLPGISSPL
mmetsp:Transcript_2398/g.9032  ORF Transcript_2398/g.9032 Transcript_2398/m.9032 type:complete len:274 (+) Transcript_2398:620-1441(+)